MNAIGWQIGAVLVGLGVLVTGIYIAKMLNSTTKTVERVNKIIDSNEKNIYEIVDNVADITTDVKNIMDVVEKITGFLRIFRIFKK